ncbi:MAG: hypothetical protein Kow0069_17370 [Promethearchaeota archaeon]
MALDVEEHRARLGRVVSLLLLAVTAGYGLLSLSARRTPVVLSYFSLAVAVASHHLFRTRRQLAGALTFTFSITTVLLVQGYLARDPVQLYLLPLVLLLSAPLSSSTVAIALLAYQTSGVGILTLGGLLAFDPYNLALLLLGESTTWASTVLINQMLVDPASRITRRYGRLLMEEKMASSRTFAGGVAHEINNAATIVLANLDLLADEGRDVTDREKLLGEIRTSIERIVELARRFLLVSKGRKNGVSLDAVVHLPALVEKVVMLALRNSNVRPDFHWEGDLPPVRGNKARLQEVFQNIALNAREAMPKGGVLRVEGKVEVEGRRTCGRRRRRSRRVVVSFEDEGQGVSPEVMPKIFDPYFTSKRGGTGLGLWVALTWVQAHGGSIKVENTSRGAKFSVILPALPAQPAAR